MGDASTARLNHELQNRVRQHEATLATLKIINGALEKENSQLRRELEENSNPVSASDQEVLEFKEECTRRVAAAENQVARLKAKLDASSRKNADANNEATQAKLREKEAHINSLQKEGESLARKNGELEATLRKMRAAAKDHEAERARINSRLKQQEDLLVRERERYEAASHATTVKVQQLQEEKDELQRSAMEQIRAALLEVDRAALEAEERARQGDSVALQAAAMREASLNATITDLTAEFEEAAAQWSKREESLRREVMQLEERLREQEVERSETVAAVSETTQPLLRQIEAMAAASADRERATAEDKRHLMDRLRDAEEARDAALEAETAVRERLASSEAALAAAQASASAAAASLAQARQQLEAERQRCAALEAEARAAMDKAAESTQRHADERAQAEAIRRELQEQFWQAQNEVTLLREEQAQLADQRHPLSRSSSLRSAPDIPQLPVSTSSHVLGESVLRRSRAGSELDMREAPSSAGVEDRTGLGQDFARLFRSAEAGSSAHQNGYRPGSAEYDPKVAHLEARLAAAEATSEQSQEELLRACQRAEAAAADARRYHDALQKLEALQTRHNLCLEILGERNERVETLEDDIQEMKHIFHSQLSSLVDELNIFKAAARRQSQDSSPGL